MKLNIHLLTFILIIGIISTSCGGGSSGNPEITPTTPNSTPSGSKSIKLTWTPPTENTNASPLQDLAGYKIYYGLNANTLTQTFTVNDSAASSATVTGLSSDTRYYFSVKAFNSNSIESDSSVIISTKTPS